MQPIKQCKVFENEFQLSITVDVTQKYKGLPLFFFLKKTPNSGKIIPMLNLLITQNPVYTKNNAFFKKILRGPLFNFFKD
jgi:hypothetical protein